MKIFLLIALLAGTVFAALASLGFLVLVRWLNLVIGAWSGPWFPPPHRSRDKYRVV